MNNETLQQIKGEYTFLQKQRREVQEKLDKKRELEQDEKVKEYLKLIDELENIDLEGIAYKNNEELLNKVIDKENITETNNIFVCMGTYRYNSETDIVHGSSDYLVPYDDLSADYRIYRNIEKHHSESYIKVKISNCRDFEENNIVFYPKGEDPIQYYKRLRRNYFGNSIRFGQEETFQKILRRHDAQKKKSCK